ncbi:MAG: HAMP domain-containing histidine kinase [Saprospiraceae bacterium]|nr:HAMP domain-containing histidine kinase [Saprospiraceae bacterium]
MTNTIIRRVILLGAFSILSLITVQTYWVMRTWDLQEREFHRKVNQALLDAANDLAVKGQFELKSTNLIDQVNSNYYVVNIENPFRDDDLQFYLQQAFEKQGMREDFQYGIFDCSSNQMVSGQVVKYSTPSAVGRIEPAAEPLSAHHNSEEFIYYFGVRFPGKNAHLLSNMWIVVVFTALMLITIAFFIYAMFVILRQKQLSELQRDFINNMTHEFKTPISTINISTDVFLKNEKIREDARLSRYAGILKEQVMRLNNQVEKVLQLAKVERDNIELHYEELELTEFVRDMLPSLELKVHEREDGQLHLDLPETPVRISADKLHLTNILHNLVDNAVKYTRGTPDIRIGIRKTGNEAVLSVQDSGIGIPKEHQRRVFDKFHRVPTGNVHNVKGFGLGLFYVKKMSKEHGWKIQIDSEPGKGTRIEIHMPAA